MWGNILTEVSYLQNFNMGFSNNKSDILIHLTQWQYWWWFWFTFLWVLYYLLVARVFRYRTLKFNPRIASTLRPHGKWGDLLTCLIPITWCINILINSNFILKLIEWQSESSLFTLRVRAKQWYWIYKLDLRNISDVYSAPRSIGRNKWQSSTFGDLQTSEDYLHLIQMRAYNTWAKDYWAEVFKKFKKKKKWHVSSPVECYKSEFLENLKFTNLTTLSDKCNLYKINNDVEGLIDGYMFLYGIDMPPTDYFRILTDESSFEDHLLSNRNYISIIQLAKEKFINLNKKRTRLLYKYVRKIGDYDYLTECLDKLGINYDTFYITRERTEPFPFYYHNFWQSPAEKEMEKKQMLWLHEPKLFRMRDYSNMFYFPPLEETIKVVFHRKPILEPYLYVYNKKAPKNVHFTRGKKILSKHYCVPKNKKKKLPNIELFTASNAKNSPFEEGIGNFLVNNISETYPNTTKVVNHPDYDEETRLLRMNFGKTVPLRIVKQPQSDIFFINNKDKNKDLELFRFRFNRLQSTLGEKPIRPTLYLTFKQKRYTLKNNINKLEFKNDGEYYSTNPFLKNKNVIEENLNNSTKQYKLIKKAKSRAERFNVKNWNRLLRSRRVLVLPAHVNITVITNSFDIVHSWHIPGLGLKMDCLPGRATHHTLYIDNVGFYYGQCAEICGRYHHHMPIRICALPFEHFLIWWHTFALPKLLFIEDKDKVNFNLHTYFDRKFSW